MRAPAGSSLQTTPHVLRRKIWSASTARDLLAERPLIGRFKAVKHAHKPRIVFVNRFFYPDVSATSQILFDLAHRLVHRGFDVHVVCSRQLYSKPDAALASEEIVHGVHVHRIWTCKFGRVRLLGRACDYLSFYLSAVAATLRVVRRDTVLIAKTDPPLISILAAVVARLKRARLVNWVQDVFPEVASHLEANPLPRWLDAPLKRLRDASLHAAEQNVVLGARMRRHFVERGIDADRLRIIENWADENAMTPDTGTMTKLRIELGLQDKFVVAYSGNMGRAHDYETILHAVEALRERTEIVFLMIGGGVRMEMLRRAAQAKNLGNILFLGYQARASLADSLATADLHLASLLPSLEGLIVPSKFYGIIAAARPIAFIGACDGELARIIVAKNCGVVVECGDGPGLAANIVRLSDDAGLRLSMGVRARELFERNYTVEKAVQKWLSVLDEVTSRYPSTDITEVLPANTTRV